jgi:hypothetical protein
MRTRWAPAVWAGAVVACAAVVLLMVIALRNLLDGGPGQPTEEEAAPTPTAFTVRTAPPRTGAIATVAALATAIGSPRGSVLVVPTASPAGTAPPETGSSVPTEQASPGLPPTPTPASDQALRTILDEGWAGPHRWPDNPQSTAWYTPTGYRLFARDAAQFVAVAAPLDAPVVDVIVSGRFRKVGGPPGGGYGLIVRDQGPGPRNGLNQIGRYYVLEAGDEGEFGIWRREGSHWIDLVPWKPTDTINPGDGTNELVVRAIGQELTFLVNGISVAVQTDTSPGEGGVGIFVGGDRNEVLLERFSVQLPE